MKEDERHVLKHRPAPSELHLNGKLIAVRAETYVFINVETTKEIDQEVAKHPQVGGHVRYYHDREELCDLMNHLLCMSLHFLESHPEAKVSFAYEEEESFRTVGYGELHSWRKDAMN